MALPPLRLLRILLPYVALWVVVAAALAAYAVHEVRSTRDRELAAGRIEAENLARVLQEQVARSVEGFQRTLGLIKIVYESDRRRTQLTGLTESLNSSNLSQIERRVLRYDRDGWLSDATDADAKRIRVSVAELPWFVAAREHRDGRIVIGEPMQGRVSGRLGIPIAVRLQAEGGEFDGALMTALDPERLIHLFRALRVGERSAVGLMDREGHLYAWSASTDPLPPGVAAPDVPRSADTRTAGEELRRLADVVDPAGVVALSAVPGTDLVVFAALSEHRLLGDWRRYAKSIVAFALLTLAGLTLPIVLVARRAAREVARRSELEHGMAVERVNARTDTLTGAANRRAFDDALAACHAELLHLRQPFVLAYVDVDRFKRLNDTRGHAVGDKALKRIAATLARSVRRSDMIARLGGDEFAVLMPNAEGHAMRRPFDAMFTSLTVAVAGEGWPISFSIGVIAFEGPPAGPQEACELADKLMYAVKASGRNGVRFAAYRDGRLHPDVGVGNADLDVGVA